MSTKRQKSSRTSPARQSPPPEKTVVGTQVLHQVQQRHYSGPIPQPEDLARYNQIVPDSAERIIRMAEEEATHRHDVERGSLAAQIEADKRKHREISRGQHYGLIATLAAFIVSAYALRTGQGAVAGTICSITVIGLAAAFITGRHKKAAKKPDQAP